MDADFLLFLGRHKIYAKKATGPFPWHVKTHKRAYQSL